MTSPSDQHELLKEILSTVRSIQNDYQRLSATVEYIQGQVKFLSDDKQSHDTPGKPHLSQAHVALAQPSMARGQRVAGATEPALSAQASSLELGSAAPSEARDDEELLYGRKHSATATSRIILTTYPGQSGIDPLTMNWGHMDALKRGPVVVSRVQSTVRRRNGKRGRSFIFHGLSNFDTTSDWCSWRLLLRLSCISSSKQTSRCGS